MRLGWLCFWCTDASITNNVVFPENSSDCMSSTRKRNSKRSSPFYLRRSARIIIGSDEDVSNTVSVSTYALGRSYYFMGDDHSAVDTIDVFRQRHESYAEEEEEREEDVEEEKETKLQLEDSQNNEDDVTIIQDIFKNEIELPIEEAHISIVKDSSNVADEVQEFEEIEQPPVPITPPAPAISRQETIAWQTQPESEESEEEEIVQLLELDRLSVSEFVSVRRAETEDQFGRTRRQAPVLEQFPLNFGRFRPGKKPHYHFVQEIYMTRAQVINGIITFGDIVVIIRSYFHAELNEFRERMEKNSRDAVNFMKILANFLYDYAFKSSYLDSIDFPIGFLFMEKMLFDVDSPLPKDELLQMLDIVGKYELFTRSYRGDHMRTLQKQALSSLNKFDRKAIEGKLTRLVLKAAGIKDGFFRKYREAGEVLLCNHPEAPIIRRLQEHLEL